MRIGVRLDGAEPGAKPVGVKAGNYEVVQEAVRARINRHRERPTLF